MANGLVSQAEQGMAPPGGEMMDPAMDPAMAPPGGEMMDPGVNPEAGGGAEVPGTAGGPDEDASPESQKAYTAAMGMVSELLYVNEESGDMIIEQIRKAEGVPEGVANAVDFILSKVEEAFEGQLPEDTILALAEEIAELVLEVVDSTDIADVDSKMAQEAMVLTGLKIMEEYGVDPEDFGEIAPEIAQSDMASVEKIIQEAG